MRWQPKHVGDAIEALQTEPPASVAWLAVAGASEEAAQRGDHADGLTQGWGCLGQYAGVWLTGFLDLRPLQVQNFRERTIALVPFVPPIGTLVCPSDVFEGDAVNLVA